MKNVKRYIVSVLLISLILTTFSYAFNLNEKYAENLSEIGVFKGSQEGFELNRKPTRLEGIVMLIRLLGREDNIEKFEINHPFEDVPKWGEPYVNYAYINGLTKGVSEKTFGSSNILSNKAYSTLMLRTLGYDDSKGEFSYNNSLKFLLEKNIVDNDFYENLTNDEFLRGDLAKLSYQVLKSKINKSDKTLTHYLIATNSLDQNKAIDIGILDEELFKKRVVNKDLVNSHNGKELLNVTLNDNNFKIESQLIDDSINYLWIQIKNLDGKKILEKNVKKVDGEFESKFKSSLDEGEYTFNAYIGEKRYGKYKGFMWDYPLYIDSDGSYFKQSPVYKNNYLKFHFEPLKKDLSRFLKESYYIKFKNEKIQNLTNEITKDIDTDYEKVKAIHNWVAENIYYNYDGYYSGDYGSVNSIEVLEKKYAVCSGYANLTAAMIRSIGIPCLVESGYALGISTDGKWSKREINTNESNHAWNQVYVDDRWIIMDVTWNSNNKYEDGEFNHGGLKSYKYFDPTLKTFSDKHKIK